MDTPFWHARWEAGEIGFHQPQFHIYLQQFWPRLGLRGGELVFVPLCGKSRDMLWLLEQGHPVLGVELSPIAVDGFFQENGLEGDAGANDRFALMRMDELELWCGDFFDLLPADLAGVEAVYDRASLVALPPEMRRRYAAHLASLIPPGCRLLLITLDYPQEQMNGPPFAVAEAEVRELFSADFEVERLEYKDVLAEEPRFRAKGLTRFEECAWRLVRK